MDNNDLTQDFTKHIEDNEDNEDLVFLGESGDDNKPVYNPHRSPRRIDYERIKAQYLIGKRELHEDGSISVSNYTVKGLCDLHGAYYPLVKARSAKEQWSLQRAAYKARLQENAENTALNIYLHEGAVADTQAMIATNKLNKIYKMALSRYDSICEAYDSDRALDDDEKIDIRELKDLLAIGKDLHTLSQQVVKSRTALVEKDMVRDLQQYKNRALPQRKTLDTKQITDKLTALQNILAPAQPTQDT